MNDGKYILENRRYIYLWGLLSAGASASLVSGNSEWASHEWVPWGTGRETRDCALLISITKISLAILIIVRKVSTQGIIIIINRVMQFYI